MIEKEMFLPNSRRKCIIKTAFKLTKKTVKSIDKSALKLTTIRVESLSTLVHILKTMKRME
jgi:hypothetical protein